MAGSLLLRASLVAAYLLGTAAGTVIAADALRSRAAASAGAEDSTAGVAIADDESVPRRDLVVCNGYAHPVAMDVVNMRSQEKLTSGKSLDYKQCGGFKPVLKEGDRLDFKVGNTSVGVFRATGLPKAVASLLLIPHRRAANSLTAAFESHAFALNGGAQIAVVDAYRGKESAKIRITDTVEASAPKEESHVPRVEDLRFNSVVSLSPGKYQVLLQSKADKELASAPLEVHQGEASYVVMRAGLGAEDGKELKSSYPQELVIFEHRSGAAAMGLSFLAAAMAAFLGLRATL